MDICLEECLGEYNLMTDWMKEDEQLNKQKDFLKTEFCENDQSDMNEQCQEDLDNYYLEMAKTSGTFIQSNITAGICEEFCKKKVTTPTPTDLPTTSIAVSTTTTTLTTITTPASPTTISTTTVTNTTITITTTIT